MTEAVLIDLPHPKGKLSSEYELRHYRFPDILVKARPELFLVVGLAPAHDGADLTAQEADITGRRPTPGHPSERLSLFVL